MYMCVFICNTMRWVGFKDSKLFLYCLPIYWYLSTYLSICAYASTVRPTSQPFFCDSFRTNFPSFGRSIACNLAPQPIRHE